MKVATALLALIAAGCGRPLGEYRFDKVEIVRPDALQATGETGPNIAYYLKLYFVSSTDMESASGGHDLYVHADFCPFRKRYGIDAIGPFYGDRSRYLPTKVLSSKYVDGRLVEVVDSQNRHPVADTKSGLFAYSAYLIPADPMPGYPHGRTNLPESTYDLRKDHRDVCVRIDSPAYDLTPSQSKVLVIPGSAIAAAFRASNLAR